MNHLPGRTAILWLLTVSAQKTRPTGSRVLLDPVVGERLDDHPGAVGVECPEHVRRRSVIGHIAAGRPVTHNL